jgi:hydroxypyruvate isomerase
MDNQNRISRRDAMFLAGAGLGSTPFVGHAQEGRNPQYRPSGKIKQAFARWCYKDIPLDNLCRDAAAMGLLGVDLVGPDDWPVLKKHGLTCTITDGAGTIRDGLNRKENHDKMERAFRESIPRAKAAGLPNVITFSGNRKGQSDQEGIENSVIGLNRVKSIAEEHGVTICLELLNSKIDHQDYQCDHTAWGVEVMKKVDSPRVRLLYDIYHMQIMEGDVIRTIRENIRWIGHFHTGGVPGRNELDDKQELNWPAIMRAIVDTGFSGYVAHEFVPTRDPMQSLAAAVKLCSV